MRFIKRVCVECVLHCMTCVMFHVAFCPSHNLRTQQLVFLSYMVRAFYLLFLLHHNISPLLKLSSHLRIRLGSFSPRQRYTVDFLIPPNRHSCRPMYLHARIFYRYEVNGAHQTYKLGVSS